jgi:predicted ATPase
LSGAGRDAAVEGSGTGGRDALQAKEALQIELALQAALQAAMAPQLDQLYARHQQWTFSCRACTYESLQQERVARQRLHYGRMQLQSRAGEGGAADVDGA